jgi:hypothetical protein
MESGKKHTKRTQICSFQDDNIRGFILPFIGVIQSNGVPNIVIQRSFLVIKRIQLTEIITVI